MIVDLALAALAGFLLVAGEPISHRIAARQNASSNKEQQ